MSDSIYESKFDSCINIALAREVFKIIPEWETRNIDLDKLASQCIELIGIHLIPCTLRSLRGQWIACVNVDKVILETSAKDPCPYRAAIMCFLKIHNEKSYWAI